MWSRSSVAVLAVGCPSAAAAADAGRMGLLAREAADALAASAPAAPAGDSTLWIGAVVLAALGASWLGTWLGLRRHAVARLRERDGWRELTYRFRSKRPMNADPNLLGRIAGVLDDLEGLSRQVKAATMAPALATAGGGLAGPGPGPVRFRRDRETEGVTARWAPAAESPRVAPAAPAVEAPRTPVRDAGRAARYREARALLRSGADRAAVRARTGLKAAEIDLLRCAPGEAP